MADPAVPRTPPPPPPNAAIPRDPYDTPGYDASMDTKNRLGTGVYGVEGRTDFNNPYKSIFGIIDRGGLYDKGAQNLLQLLNNPGQTDFRTYNRGVRDLSRSTTSRLGDSRKQFANRGLGNSGLAAAMQEAIRGSGADQEQTLRENEGRRREELRRADLEMFREFIQRPNIERYGADRGISLQENTAKKQQNASYAGAAASLIGSLAAAFCHTADELYGVDSQGATLARWYMLKHATPETYELYAEGSRDLAARVKADPKLRAEAQEVFDEFVEFAREDFPMRLG